MTTIKDIFGLERVLPYPKQMPSKSGPDNNLLYGLELEIEFATPEWEGNGFRATEDGSLRHDGWEFISSPMNYDTIVDSLKRFFKRAQGISFDPDNVEHYSERTSVHVHTNCQDLTIPQVSSILLLYQVTERLLFNWIGNDRDKNIFCVPWSETLIRHQALNDLTHYISMSSVERNKYTALNIVPLKSIGTIEWRHMAGEYNVDHIAMWLRIIGHFFRIARVTPYEEILDRVVNLNTSSQYDNLLDWVFQDEVIQLRQLGYTSYLEDGVLSVKYSLMKPAKLKTNKTAEKSFDTWRAEVELARRLQDAGLDNIANRYYVNAGITDNMTVGVQHAVDPQPEQAVTGWTQGGVIRGEVVEQGTMDHINARWDELYAAEGLRRARENDAVIMGDIVEREAPVENRNEEGSF